MNYKKIAKESRKKVLDMIYKAQTSHIGSNLSCADIMAVLFEKINLDKDKFVLSAGWKAAMLYYHLWRKGRITKKELNSYCKKGSKWIGLAEPVCKDIIIAGGSMQMGLPGAVGLALAKKLKKEDGNIYVLMSDGEIAGGMTWESLLIANQNKLNNLIIFIDYNGLQAMGDVKKVLNIEPILDKFKAFGCSPHFIDGHDYSMIEKALYIAKKGIDRPLVFIAKTIKGKGVDFMENDNLWHYAQIKKDDYKKAILCLK